MRTRVIRVLQAQHLGLIYKVQFRLAGIWVTYSVHSFEEEAIENAKKCFKIGSKKPKVNVVWESDNDT